MAKKILIAGRERNLSHFVSMELQKKEYLVDYASTGKEALSLAHETDFDLILMSFQLSDMSSKELSRELLAIKPASVMIVAIDSADVAQHGEEVLSYAVSYVVKPFVISDLVEQITAIFRGRDFIDKNCKHVPLQAAYRDLKVDFQNRTVTRGDELINLTRREYDLLATLMNSPEPVSREQLLERVWKYEAASETNVVDVYIRYLRGKLDIAGKPSYIKTVRGVGYAMRD
ncbi:TPA: winged helix-turn-helix domain-containing protein [Streptococcus suis]|nr:winged helix-turn-helix domain-containing protein [Streptococcus suis]